LAAAPPTPVPGIDIPDILRIEDVKVVGSYQNPGDQLYLISYKLIYNDGDPAVPASDYFSFQATIGGSIVAQVPVRMWGYRPGSIYLAAGSALPWGSAVTIKIIGNADKWTVPPEYSYVLSAGDWVGVDISLIDPWVISLAENIGTTYSTEMVIYSPEGTVLSAQGGALFSMGIPGLAVHRPSLFKTSIGYVDPDDTTWDDTLQPGLNPEEQLGPYLYDVVSNYTTELDAGSPQSTWGFMIMLIFALLVVALSMRFGFVGGFIGSIPVILAGMWTGGIAIAIVMIVAAIAIVLVLKQVWIRGN